MTYTNDIYGASESGARELRFENFSKLEIPFISIDIVHARTVRPDDTWFSVILPSVW